MDYYLKKPDSTPIDARVTVDQSRITLHSRSGRSPASPRGRNPGYVAALDTIFDRLNIPDIVIDRVVLDSSQSHAVPEEQRILASRADFETGVLSQVKNQIRSRMRNFGRSEDMPSNEGNQNKKIRIDTSIEDIQILRRLRVVPAPGRNTLTAQLRAEDRPENNFTVERLSATDLRRVQLKHIEAALRRLDAGDRAESFATSREYDALNADGRKYAPKKVFGLALEEALGIEAKPRHFSAGWNTPCFQILEANGLWIVPKSSVERRPYPTPTVLEDAEKLIVPTDEERTWIEGNPKIAVHLHKERRPGLARKKREQFVRDHGRLVCERCDLDPAITYGPEAGHACIEVHHHRTHVADMQRDHETSLDDLKCLCSNCHRVLHRALSLGLPFDF